MVQITLGVEISYLEHSTPIYFQPYLMLAWNPTAVSESPCANITIFLYFNQLMLVNHLVKCMV
jgi:hypothetical protein